MRETTGATAPRLDVTAAANIRAEMARRRITGRALADQLGRSQMWLSRRLNGDTAFGLDELEAVAAAIGVPVAQLLEVAA